MKMTTTIVLSAAAGVLMFLVDTSPKPSESLLSFQVVQEAEAIAGRQRRTRRRGVAVGYQAGKAAASQQQQSGAEQ